MLFLVQIDLTGADLAAFERHEAVVLPLLAEHGARIERRLRGPDDDFETHVLNFPSQAALDAYLADPRRAAAAELWLRSGATAERWEVTDLPVKGASWPSPASLAEDKS